MEIIIGLTLLGTVLFLIINKLRIEQVKKKTQKYSEYIEKECCIQNKAKQEEIISSAWEKEEPLEKALEVYFN